MRTRRSFWQALVAGLGCFLLTIPLGCKPPETSGTSSTTTPEATTPTTTETTEPATTEPATTEPATTEPAAEPAPTEPALEPPTQPATQPATEPAAVEVETMTIAVPLGLPKVPVPDDNPMTAAKVELGKQLYFDKRLSRDGTISCATCHDPQTAWAELKATSEGIEGKFGARNAPTVINSAYADAQFWDGRAATLEEQALGPIANPIEMGHTLDAMISQLSELDGYTQQFQEVFGTGVTEEGVAKAIAAFERTVLSGNSPYDKYDDGKGDPSALTDAQKRGKELFETVGCADCHTPPLFSNYGYFNAGVGMDAEKPDEGRKDVTGKDSDLGKFRVPALREVAGTAPYFHDGSTATLEEAVALMATGGKDNANLSMMLKGIREANLTAEDQADLVEFMKALSGEYPIVEPPTEFPQ